MVRTLEDTISCVPAYYESREPAVNNIMFTGILTRLVLEVSISDIQTRTSTRKPFKNALFVVKLPLHGLLFLISS